MLPREDYWRELASLAVWWSLWSLADTYLLPWTPVFELATVSAVSLGFALLSAGKKLMGMRTFLRAWCCTDRVDKDWQEIRDKMESDDDSGQHEFRATL